ncbi:pentapeptide repeat-containing protein [uncultured Tenacibaculum sp.]|uniref:pentapeptide repeat-containing protein n=1 Tax=uncultured Tenacibaculum sp. TaxID=174713 RepID=UPI0026032255|nr:pentapeptide repeat-containing protein [uncultured Tenacibaculum sp.]
MEDNLQNELEKLQKENDALRAKVDRANQKAQRKQERTKKTLSWTWKLFTGASLNKNFNNWFTEFHTERKVSPDTSANLLTSLVQRFVRVRLLSVILLLFSIVPSLVSLYILVKQNDLIRTQNALVEGTRKSSYSFQLEGIYDAIGRNNGKVTKNIRSRIISLSHSLTPYKILEEDGKLSNKTYSSERTQLLLFLVNSGINTSELDKIYAASDFSHCYFKNTNLTGAYLSGINLANSNFENAELQRAKLDGANLTNSNLKNIQFSNGWARNTIFINTDLTDARITKAKDLSGADFTDAEISNTNFDLSELKNVKGL